MRNCKECSHINVENMYCIIHNDFKEELDSCTQFELDKITDAKCLFCKHYNILSYICTKDKSTVSAHFSCKDFKGNLEEEFPTTGFIGIVVGGCTTHEHGTDLYKRCKEWLETIKTDNSKTKGIRVIFTKHDYPTTLFWISFMEKVYHLYTPEWIKDKLCFRGLTPLMINDALNVRDKLKGA
jgi:hypothetical protein